MKILILVDTLNHWALHNRAKAIKKFMPQHEIEIRAACGGCDLSDHEQFDVLHFNFTWGLDSYIDFILENKNKCLLTVVNERSLLQGVGIKPARMEAFKAMFRECPHKTAVNINMAQLVGGVYIPNGIDEQLFNQYRAPIIGYSGTGMPNKNLNLVEKACKDIGLELKVAGYRYKNNDREPDYPHEKMLDFYKTIDVFVHASITEGFSNTIIEALSVNIPVIMTRQGAWQEFEGWVEFIEPNVEDIKRALQKFTGRKLIEYKFLWRNIMPQYEEMYKKIAEAKKEVKNEDSHRVQAQQNA